MPADGERDCRRCGAATEVVETPVGTERRCVDDDCPWWVSIGGTGSIDAETTSDLGRFGDLS